ncbi:uncharacterized protein LOC143667137 [Tamandua tetradactyla]|uniref:uncharacterized protein LOC143667137 n=1 Tax=Tamandua tetradactyla TaxID=48850 RepID=UPI0040541056
MDTVAVCVEGTKKKAEILPYSHVLKLTTFPVTLKAMALPETAKFYCLYAQMDHCKWKNTPQTTPLQSIIREMLKDTAGVQKASPDKKIYLNYFSFIFLLHKTS